MGDSKEAFAEIAIEAHDTHNQIANQLRKDVRVFGEMQRMVWKRSQKGPSPIARRTGGTLVLPRKKVKDNYVA